LDTCIKHGKHGFKQFKKEQYPQPNYKNGANKNDKKKR
jgi:hypothetical protein